MNGPLDTFLKFLQETKSPVSSILDLRSLLVTQKEEKIELENGLRQMGIEMEGIRLVNYTIDHLFSWMDLIIGRWLKGDDIEAGRIAPTLSYLLREQDVISEQGGKFSQNSLANRM